MSVIKDPRLRWLYLGSSQDAKNLDWLKKKKIRYIMNATCEVPQGGVPNYHRKDQSFEYCRIKLSDNDSECLSHHYQQIWDFFERALIREDGCMLVHCKLGVSRSASCILAFLIKFMKMPYSQALNLLIASRPEVYPNSDFRQQLRELSEQLEKSHDYFSLPFAPSESLLLSGRFLDTFQSVGPRVFGPTLPPNLHPTRQDKRKGSDSVGDSLTTSTPLTPGSPIEDVEVDR